MGSKEEWAGWLAIAPVFFEKSKNYSASQVSWVAKLAMAVSPLIMFADWGVTNQNGGGDGLIALGKCLAGRSRPRGLMLAERACWRFYFTVIAGTDIYTALRAFPEVPEAEDCDYFTKVVAPEGFEKPKKKKRVRDAPAAPKPRKKQKSVVPQDLPAYSVTEPTNNTFLAFHEWTTEGEDIVSEVAVCDATVQMLTHLDSGRGEFVEACAYRAVDTREKLRQAFSQSAGALLITGLPGPDVAWNLDELAFYCASLDAPQVARDTSTMSLENREGKLSLLTLRQLHGLNENQHPLGIMDMPVTRAPFFDGALADQTRHFPCHLLPPCTWASAILNGFYQWRQMTAEGYSLLLRVMVGACVVIVDTPVGPADDCATAHPWQANAALFERRVVELVPGAALLLKPGIYYHILSTEATILLSEEFYMLHTAVQIRDALIAQRFHPVVRRRQASGALMRIHILKTFLQERSNHFPSLNSEHVITLAYVCLFSQLLSDEEPTGQAVARETIAAILGIPEGQAMVWEALRRFLTSYMEHVVPEVWSDERDVVIRVVKEQGLPYLDHFVDNWFGLAEQDVLEDGGRTWDYKAERYEGWNVKLIE